MKHMFRSLAGVAGVLLLLHTVHAVLDDNTTSSFMNYVRQIHPYSTNTLLYT